MGVNVKHFILFKEFSPAKIVKGKLVADTSHALAILPDTPFLLRKLKRQCLDEIFISLGVPVDHWVIPENDGIETLFIHFPQVHFLHYPKEPEQFKQVLTFAEPAHIVNSRVKDPLVAHEGLKRTPDLFVLFEHTDVKPFSRQYRAA
jgi:hypothetical protein